MESKLNFIDIGANLCDPMYKGIYNGKQKHTGDLDHVLDRALEKGLTHIIITSGDLETLQEAVNLIKHYNSIEKYKCLLWTTCGVHPTCCGQFDSDPDLLSKLIKFAQENIEYIVAVGEFGLDYERLEFCAKDVQNKYFELQFQICDALKLPLFLHNRSCHEDFHRILTQNRHRFDKAVVHSFTGTYEEAAQYVEMGLFIGINGCSLKAEENLQVVAKIPSQHIMIETDGPWCEVRPTHAGSKFLKTKFDSVKREKWTSSALVKSRNEPCQIVSVLEIIAALKQVPDKELADKIYSNTKNVFFPTQK